MNEMNFQEGDNVMREHDDCSEGKAKKGVIYTVRRSKNGSLSIGDQIEEVWQGKRQKKDVITACSCYGGWTLVERLNPFQTLTINRSSNKSMNILTSKIKRLFNANLQKQYKAGLIDNCGDLTQKGREELDLIIRDKFDEDLVRVAEEIIAEEKENK